MGSYPPLTRLCSSAAFFTPRTASSPDTTATMNRALFDSRRTSSPTLRTSSAFRLRYPSSLTSYHSPMMSIALSYRLSLPDRSKRTMLVVVSDPISLNRLYNPTPSAADICSGVRLRTKATVVSVWYSRYVRTSPDSTMASSSAL